MQIYQFFTASVLPAHCPCPVSLIVSTSIIALPKTKECHQFSSLGSCTETLQQTNANCCLTHTHLEEHFIQHTIDFSHKSNPVVLVFFSNFHQFSYTKEKQRLCLRCLCYALKNPPNQSDLCVFPFLLITLHNGHTFLNSSCPACFCPICCLFAPTAIFSEGMGTHHLLD